MIEKYLAAAVLAASAHGALAQPVQSWTFVWEGPFAFDDGSTGKLSIPGSFSAVDADGDGIIVASEVTLFHIIGYDILPCAATECSLWNFRYGGGNDLTFGARSFQYYPPDPFFPWPVYITEDWDTVRGAWNSQFCTGPCHDWDNRVALPGVTMTVTPVPEPGSCAMLAAGLSLLGWSWRRVHRQALR